VRTHLAQLDALRAIAVLGVMVHHAAPDRFKGLTGYAASGGVKLFFVLSGFLITGILLSAGFALDIAPVRRALWPLATFTFNGHMIAQGFYEPNYAHFWSLSVEQQFYMFWPWIILIAPRRWLLPAACAMITAGPVYRILQALMGDADRLGLTAYISTWTSLDALGFGALLAMARQEPWGASLHPSLGRFGVPLAVVALVAIVVSGSLRADLLLWDTAAGVIFLWLIWGAAEGFTGTAGRLLGWKPLLHLGMVSYGAYVYHPFVPEFCHWAAATLGWHALADPWILAGLTFIVTIVTATLSWRYIEAPINRLKRHVAE
jgi:peptidoglycan/LPS O-acetylase OafA/YrhL